MGVNKWARRLSAAPLPRASGFGPLTLARSRALAQVRARALARDHQAYLALTIKEMRALEAEIERVLARPRLKFPRKG